MSEQSLKAVVVPEVDPTGLQTFVAQLSEMLAQANIPLGVNISSGGSDSPSGGGGSNLPATTGSSGGSDGKELVENTAQGVAQGLKKSVDDDPKTGEKMQMPTTMSLSSILKSVGGVAGAVGVGAIGVAGLTMGILKFLESASPPLKNVMDLFSTAFNLIWMPVGTLLAVQMMPVLKGVFQKVSNWMKVASVLFGSEEGAEQTMGELIAGAMGTSFGVLIDLLSQEEFLSAIGRTLWALWQLPLETLLAPLIGPENAFKYVQAGLDMLIAIVSAIWHFLTLDWDALGGDLKKMGSSFDKMNDLLWSRIPEILQKVFDWIMNNTTFGKVLNKLDEWLASVTGKSVGEHLGTFTENTQKGWDSMMDSFSSGDVLGGLGKALEGTPGGQLIKGIGGALGIHAEGGIVTSPEIGIIGEAGPEAIIPLNQLHQVANDYRTINGLNGGNVITINIDGAKDPVAVGEEVQRILEKTVGKASSKMPWW